MQLWIIQYWGFELRRQQIRYEHVLLGHQQKYKREDSTGIYYVIDVDQKQK